MRKKALNGVYFIDFGNGVKIGRSTDIKKRLRVYMSPWCRNIIDIYYFECQNSICVENKVMAHFRGNAKDTESKEFITDVNINEIVRYAYSERTSRVNGEFLSKEYTNPTIMRIRGDDILKVFYPEKEVKIKPRNEKDKTRIETMTRLMSQHRERIEKRGTPKAD